MVVGGGCLSFVVVVRVVFVVVGVVVGLDPLPQDLIPPRTPNVNI